MIFSYFNFCVHILSSFSSVFNNFKHSLRANFYVFFWTRTFVSIKACREISIWFLFMMSAKKKERHSFRNMSRCDGPNWLFNDIFRELRSNSYGLMYIWGVYSENQVLWTKLTYFLHILRISLHPLKLYFSSFVFYLTKFLNILEQYFWCHVDNWKTMNSGCDSEKGRI